MIEIIEIDTDHELYKDEVKLRYEVLRKPIGYATLEPFPFEKSPLSRHFIAVENASKDVIGCVLFHIEGKRLFQMAVRDDYQKKGVGKQLVEHLEKAVNVFEIFLHARHYAIGFYEKLGYVPYGDTYIEVGM